MPRAAIDLGSNSVLLTVVDDAGRVVHDEARVVGLGRGLGDRGVFRPDRKAAAEAALAEYVATAAGLGVAPNDIRAVATSAARRATDADTWFGHVERQLGVRFAVLSGEREAELTWRGAQVDLDVPGPLLVVDVGGGSTELVSGNGEEIRVQVSLELGSVRLTERFLCAPGATEPDHIDPRALDRLRVYVDSELAAVSLVPLPRTVVAVAGSATTLAATLLGLYVYDGAAVHGQVVSRAELTRLVDTLAGASSAERRARVPTAPDRADWLPAAGVLFDRILEAAAAPSLVVSDRGLRYGLLT
jgi:exopolyphosphatase/guanosine-5'-triphosphate,3'-diphosphate pyrophosphatase